MKTNPTVVKKEGVPFDTNNPEHLAGLEKWVKKTVKELDALNQPQGILVPKSLYKLLKKAYLPSPLKKKP